MFNSLKSFGFVGLIIVNRSTIFSQILVKLKIKTYIVVTLEQTKEPHLSEHSVSVNFIFKEVLDLLDGNNLVVFLRLAWVPLSLVHH